MGNKRGLKVQVADKAQKQSRWLLVTHPTSKAVRRFNPRANSQSPGDRTQTFRKSRSKKKSMAAGWPVCPGGLAVRAHHIASPDTLDKANKLSAGPCWSQAAPAQWQPRPLHQGQTPPRTHLGPICDGPRQRHPRGPRPQLHSAERPSLISPAAAATAAATPPLPWRSTDDRAARVFFSVVCGHPMLQSLLCKRMLEEKSKQVGRPQDTKVPGPLSGSDYNSKIHFGPYGQHADDSPGKAKQDRSLGGVDIDAASNAPTLLLRLLTPCLSRAAGVLPISAHWPTVRAFLRAACQPHVASVGSVFLTSGRGDTQTPHDIETITLTAQTPRVSTPPANGIAVNMVIQPFIDARGYCTVPSDTRRGHTAALQNYENQPQTPPGSASGSPSIKDECLCPDSPQQHTPVPGLLHLNSPHNNTQVRLPSLGEFDLGVEELARAYGPINSWTPPSPLSANDASFLQSLRPIDSLIPSWTNRDRSFEDPATEFFCARRRTITSLSQYALACDQASQALQGYNGSESYPNYGMSSPSLQGHGGMDSSYPSPPPEGENRHINQKYTTEEGDFIIYAWHDRKMKWQRIKQEFATMFGRTPERTVQGLQAWYYRMNQRIPIWDEDGWLCFDNEDDLEPRQIGIKCRERDSQDKPMEPLGLAQRYPERAINYPWVDPELKHKSRDWAAKRDLQYRERRERRKRKEHRRMKLNKARAYHRTEPSQTWHHHEHGAALRWPHKQARAASPGDPGESTRTQTRQVCSRTYWFLGGKGRQGGRGLRGALIEDVGRHRPRDPEGKRMKSGPFIDDVKTPSRAGDMHVRQLGEWRW
ncbi:hypothetical protein G7046_g328 [Stylonectria norvegica]|nr:hypothetical protein G7046_g328 [Stylonectria norvegica]